MEKWLVVTEKPSVAKDIARILNIPLKNCGGYYEGNRYLVSWAVGHLVALASPDQQDPVWDGKWSLENLPIIMDRAKFIINDKTKDQFQVIKNLIHRTDVAGIINAGDSGREGEAIQRLIYMKAGNNKPIKRLWVDDLTDETIKKGFSTLVDGNSYVQVAGGKRYYLNNLFEAALCRMYEDYETGMTFTREFSVLSGCLLRIGRVKSPTVNMVVERDREIEHFKPKDFFQVEDVFKNNSSQEYLGTLIDPTSKEIVRFQDREDAEKVKRETIDQAGEIIFSQTKRRYSERPKLYNITTLQADAAKYYGIMPDKALSVLQALYEKKITSYPRTDSSYLTENMKGELINRLSDIAKRKQYHEIATPISLHPVIDKNIIDNSKVTDHYALIITGNYRSCEIDSLSKEEQVILHMIVTRMIAACANRFSYDESVILTKVCNTSYFFKSSGKIVTDYGYKDVESKLLPSKQAGKDVILPEVKKGELVNVSSSNVISKKTSPPKRFKMDTLLAAMEHAGRQVQDKGMKEILNEVAGIGRPATRAGIITEIFSCGYFKFSGKGKNPDIVSTEKARLMTDVLPEDLKSPLLTAKWEQHFDRIAQGEENAAEFLQQSRQSIRDLCEASKSLSIKDMFEEIRIAEYQQKHGGGKEVVGKCPLCQGLILENQKGFYCNHSYGEHKSCDFPTVWKDNKFFSVRGKKVTASVMKNLLTKGKVSLKGFKKKDGSGTYSATVTVKWHVPYKKPDGTEIFVNQFELEKRK